jgi:hypothetical protein
MLFGGGPEFTTSDSLPDWLQQISIVGSKMKDNNLIL